MARVAFEIPKIGLVMQAVKLQRWLKNVGDVVKVGEPLLEVETEKSVVEIEAAFGGRLLEILLPEGAEANVGDQAAWLEADEAVAAPPAALPATPTPAASSVVAVAAAAPATSVPAAAPAAGRAQFARGAPPGRRAWAGPRADRRQRAARARAAGRRAGRGRGARRRSRGVARRRGGGRRGRSRRAALPAMRRALARAMTLSNATVLQFTLERAVDMTTLQSARAALSLALPAGTPKLSVNDFLMQAVARALLEFPALNATFAGDPASHDARIVPRAARTSAWCWPSRTACWCR
ncbi:MAG: biotin/lipoyl-containing protein [Steroidobacteraceae bacterium]